MTIFSTSTFLNLIAELTIGQRATDNPEDLSLFLHRKIFPKLGPFAADIYYPDPTSKRFLPPPPLETFRGRGLRTPIEIPADHPLVTDLLRTGNPVEHHSSRETAQFLAATANSSHMLVPLLDGATISALLYIGSKEPQPFTAEFRSALQTLATVIGSHLKSMESIKQLKNSMHALEYSEQLRAALYNISELAHNCERMEDLYSSLHQTIGHLLHAPNFIIALVENRPNGSYISFPYYVDAHDTLLFKNMEIKLDQKKKSLTQYLLQSRQPLLLTPDNYDRICAENEICVLGTRPHSWLGAPFYLEHLSGAVVVQSYSEVVYTEKDKGLMAYVARQVGDALSRRRTLEELKEAKDRAEQAEKKKSAFLANMSHEIRTPMNGIIGMTKLVLDMEIPAQQRTYLNMVHTSADRLLKLINDILDFSKIEAGKFELDIAPFDLRDAISKSLQFLTINAAAKDIDLNVLCDSDIPTILLGDEDKLCQIIINLVNNALKFTVRGSVTLEITPAAGSTRQSGQIRLHFRVTDTGTGIPPEKINKLFKAFNQVGITRDSNHRGTGLGLVIAAELVEMMGGKIRVESQPGVGSSFHFTAVFQLSHSEIEQQTVTDGSENTSQQSQPCARPRSILLVEDEYINRTLAIAILEREGWQVTTAENGRKALEILKMASFDLILMDIQMPELNGYDTTRIIRQSETADGRHIPIIAITAYAVKGDQEKCIEAGMDGYISKPIRPDLLHTEIESILHRQ